MKDMKLSLHPVKWRMALTEESAATRLDPETDRVLTRWEHPREFAAGWRLGATIVVPHRSLVPPFPEKEIRKVRWFPSPGAGRALRFIVLLGAPVRETLTVLDHIGDVGRISLATGGAVWVIAYDDVFDVAREDQHDLLRQSAASNTEDEVYGMAWGNNDTDGSPIMLELGNVAPSGSNPA
ncbi:hypothetical protein ACIBQ0_15870 [Nocardia nova]|uniref:hypothetical protein n=1 Tax=Nocardia nova TaxID=37330 RepID=UPI0037BD413B